MCQTHSQQDQTITGAGSVIPQNGGFVGGPLIGGRSVASAGQTAGAGVVNGDPLSSAIQAEAAANPQTASVNSPTKFGKLLSFIAPLAQGAAIGAFAGKGHPGGGFGAATDFYNQQRQMQMQRQLQIQQLANQQTANQQKNAEILLDAARTQHVINQPEFVNSRLAEVQDPNDPDSTLVQARDPQSGAWQTIGRKSAKSDKFTPINSAQGIYAMNTSDASLKSLTTGAVPTTVPTTAPTSAPAGYPVGPGQFGGADATPRIPTTAPGSGTAQFGGATASPRLIQSGTAPGVPLMPPGTISAKNPKPVKVTNRGTSGFESDSLIDENPQSPTFGQPLKQNIASRAPTPREADTGSDAEQVAAAAMDKFAGDPDQAIKYVNSLKTGDPTADKHLSSILPLVRKSIRDRAKPGKTGRQRLTPDQVQQLSKQNTANSSVLDDDDND